MKKPWMRNHKPLMVGGQPVLCSVCPCTTERTCTDAVDAEVSRLLSLEDAETGFKIWEQIDSGIAQYTCAVWQQNLITGNWDLIQQAQGELLVAVKAGVSIADTTSSMAYLLVYARVLRNKFTNAIITIGCRCVVDGYECEHQMITLSDYRLAGRLPVWTPDEDDSSETYTPSDSCRVDVCELGKLKLTYAQTLHGGTLYNEGYWDWWDDEWWHSEYTFQYERFLLGVEWFDAQNNKKFSYIPCACDSEYATTTTLTADKIPHEFAGICAINDNCALSLMMKRRDYADQIEDGQAVWEEVAFVSTDYQCIEMEYDEETGSWNVITPANGHLVVAMCRPYNLHTGGYTWGYGYITFVHACTVHNRLTGEYRTFGCTCEYSYSTYECQFGFQDYENFCIGGVLPVKQPEEESSSDSVIHWKDDPRYLQCSVNVCDAYILMLQCYEEWYGGTLYNEGYVEEIDGNGDFTYTKFRMAYVGTGTDPEDWEKTRDYYISLSCDCSISADFLGDNSSIHEATGICSNPECEKVFILRQSAIAHGWAWYDEGVLVHLAYSMHYDEQTWEPVFFFGDWYDSGSRTAYLACAETPDCFYAVSCGCQSITRINKDSIDWYTPIDMPEDFWHYLEYEGACSCVDERELLLEYPDVFGVLEISYGNNSKYAYTQTTTYEDMIYNDQTGEYEWGTITNTTNGFNVCGHRTGNYGQDLFLDYRTFCWIGKHIADGGTQNVCVRWISPAGSPAGDGTGDRIYDSASFTGYVYPFETDNDTGMQWWGQYYQWRSEAYAFDEYYQTEAEAQEACASRIPAQPSVCGISGYDGPRYAPCVTPPDTTLTLHAGRVHYETWSVDYPWVCSPPYYTMGQAIGEGVTVVYRVQWIQTNLGILRSGESQYLPSFTLYGLHGSHGNQDWESCYDHSGAPYEDTTITATLIDSDMHGCHDVDWQQSDSESYSESV